jgi:cytochrome b involved in lipid metabolism
MGRRRQIISAAINLDRSRRRRHTLRIRSWFGCRRHQDRLVASQIGGEEPSQVGRAEGVYRRGGRQAQHQGGLLGYRKSCFFLAIVPLWDAPFTRHDEYELIFIPQVEGKVLDVTNFLPDHPGGEKAILLYAGRDATEEFLMLHDAKVIPRYAPEATIGVLKK